MPRFSLIVPTRGRPLELAKLFSSLEIQSRDDFEVILIDQNSDEETARLVDDFVRKKKIVKHLRPGSVSLSKARNLGLAQAEGDLIAFPDDDCHYSSNLLAEMDKEFADDSIGIVCVRGEDFSTRRALLSSFPRTRVTLSEKNIFGIGMSITLFFRASAIRGELFDESLGVGCSLGSGEETDFLIRTFDRGVKGVFVPNLVVYHPLSDSSFDKSMQTKAKSYGLGYGFVMRRHFRLSFTAHFLRGMLIRPLGGIIVSIPNIPKMVWCWTIFRSRWEGFFFDPRRLERLK